MEHDHHGMRPSGIDDRRLVTAKAWRRANDVPGKAFGDPTLFANPALNILLDLYISAREAQPVNVSSAKM